MLISKPQTDRSQQFSQSESWADAGRFGFDFRGNYDVGAILVRLVQAAVGFDGRKPLASSETLLQGGVRPIELQGWDALLTGVPSIDFTISPLLQSGFLCR
jgi:hypothetical protein